MGSDLAMFPTDRPLAEDFERTEVTIDGETKPVWRSGNGPGVIIMHEVPGITLEVARFARIVRDRGFTVFLPEMFGTVDKPVSGGNTAPSSPSALH
ncbi:MAG: dienelactone hydrolase family protein [Deltaproteobacteria bacterium]|nr:dienelactone hydrolase family protein [Deltaproteobacteria bacterium]